VVVNVVGQTLELDVIVPTLVFNSLVDDVTNVFLEFVPGSTFVEDDFSILDHENFSVDLGHGMFLTLNWVGGCVDG
jgi:hypothetical protein